MASFAGNTALLAFAGAMGVAPAALAQCTSRWLGAHGGPALSGSVRAIAEWDADGAGPNPALPVVGGAFSSAGGTTLNNLAAWTPSGWAAVGGGTSGGALNGQVSALAVLPGGDLVAAGLFTSAGGVPALNIARFDGQAWHALGDGLTGQGTPSLGGVRALLVLPGGGLIAGGDFSASGSTALNRVARWDGAAWSAVGTGMTRQTGAVYTPAVFALALASNGDVVAGGQWTHADGIAASHIARYTGSGWQAMGSGFNAFVGAVLALPTGDIIAGGDFSASGALALTRVARWNGAWSGMGSGFDAAVRGLAVDQGGAPVAVGFFTRSGAPGVSRAGRWNGAAWVAMGTGLNGDALCARALESGEVGVGGAFSTAGGVSAYGLARWTSDNEPWFAAHPADVHGACGSSVTMTAGAAPGFAGVAYQWRHNGVDLTPEENPSAHSPALLIEPVTPGVAGSYECVITSACGGDTTASAELIVDGSCCTADFDLNGFVNGDDADGFVVLFGAGDPGADLNGDTFVTGEDFDLFMAHFDAGC